MPHDIDSVQPELQPIITTDLVQRFREIATPVATQLVQIYYPYYLHQLDGLVAHIKYAYMRAFLTVRPVQVLFAEPEGEQLVVVVLGQHRRSYTMDVRYLYGEIYVFLQLVPVD